mgnify:CR=1 FL=1
MPEDIGKKVSFVSIDETSAGQRLDNYLLKMLKGVPKSHIYRIVRKGEVRINKGRASVKTRLQMGDIVRIPPVVMRQQANVAGLVAGQLRRLENSIIYEDKDFLILNKPTGMAVHGGSGISHGVIETLRAMRPNEKGLELAHRLDRDTSGCLLIAKKRAALTMFHERQRRGKVEKKYLALVDGHWGRKTSITIDAPLHKNTLRGGERMVQVDPQGKDAITHFKIIESFADCMLVEALLETGRTHQIRVHLQYANTPIIGDDKYGNTAINKAFRQRGLHRLFLHALSLSFMNTNSGKKIQVQAPLDDELSGAVDLLESENKSDSLQ